jgi:hypothetical protein
MAAHDCESLQCEATRKAALSHQSTVFVSRGRMLLVRAGLVNGSNVLRMHNLHQLVSESHRFGAITPSHDFV